MKIILDVNEEKVSGRDFLNMGKGLNILLRDVLGLKEEEVNIYVKGRWTPNPHGNHTNKSNERFT